MERYRIKYAGVIGKYGTVFFKLEKSEDARKSWETVSGCECSSIQVIDDRLNQILAGEKEIIIIKSEIKKSK